jgi:chromosome partitioning protein
MIVSIANLKGGTGKTTTVVNLGSALAMNGYKTLIIDLVPQGDATFSLGAHTTNFKYSLADVLLKGQKLENATLETSTSRLFIVPASPDLIDSDLKLAPKKGREGYLAANLTTYLRRDFDFILLDCPSTANLLLVNALYSSDFLLIPTTPSFLSVRGLREILRVQEELKRNMNCGVEFMGILLTMIDYRISTTVEIIGNLRSTFGKKVLNTTIERVDSLMECPDSHTSILHMRPGSPAARSFLRLMEEFVSRVGIESKTERTIADKSDMKLFQGGADSDSSEN